MKCKRCGMDFETKDKRRKYCSPRCSKFSRLKTDPIFGGGVRRRGNSVEVTGAINCMLFMRGLL